MNETICIGGFGNKWGNQYHQQSRVYQIGDVALCHPANIPGGSYMYLEVKKMSELIMLGQMDNTADHTLESANRVYSKEGVCPTVLTCAGGNIQPKFLEIKHLTSEKGGTTCLSRAEQSRAEQSRAEQSSIVYVRQATKDGVIPLELDGVADLTFPTSQTRRGRVQGNGQISPTLTTENIPSVLEKWIWEIDGETYLIRIRKLTPRECWRLMGFYDSDFDKAQEVNSNTQLYKQAGNSIVVNVLESIFKGLIV